MPSSKVEYAPVPVRCQSCVVKNCDVTNFNYDITRAAPHAVDVSREKMKITFCVIYKVVIIWIITSCLLASTSTYLAFRSQLNGSVQILTGQVLGRINSLLYAGTWLCFFSGILGPILIGFVCLSMRPAFAVPLAVITFAGLFCPCVGLLSKVLEQVMVALNTTDINDIIRYQQLNVSPQLQKVLGSEVWNSLHNSTWTNGDSVGNAWDDMQVEFKCCGVIEPEDWRKRNQFASWICDDALPETCYRQYFKKRSKLFDCEVQHEKGCWPTILSIVEDTLRNAFIRLFCALIVMVVWGLVAISCAWVWLYLRQKQNPKKTKVASPLTTISFIESHDTA